MDISLVCIEDTTVGGHHQFLCTQLQGNREGILLWACLFVKLLRSLVSLEPYVLGF